ncbi:MAG: peptidylprolyl isomerase [Pseudomonadota bacterium]
MNRRFPILALGLAAALALPALPAAAQGLRIGPQAAPAAPRAGGAVSTGPQSADYIVAVVNSEPITNNEVRLRTLRFAQQLQQQGGAVPPAAQLAREVLERLVSEKAQLQLARETGLKVDEAAVDQAELNVARQNQMEVADFRRRMRAEGMDPAQYREDLRNQLTLTRLREREMEGKVKVGELDIDHYIREQQSGAGDPAGMELNLAHILVAVPETANDAQAAALRAKAQLLLQRARGGEDFAKLARENSDAPGAAGSGGQIGMRTADRLPPVFLEAVRRLPQGGVSDVVRSAAGFHIVKVLEKHQLGLPGLAVTQTHARHILLRLSPQLSEAAARARLADFKKRIESGSADFAQLARESSQDGSARSGGDLGWANPGLFVPEFEETLASLSPGKIADPIVTRFGVHLIQLLERRQATLGQREQREMVRALLREKKLDEAYAQWAQEVRGRAYVEYREPPQ